MKCPLCGSRKGKRRCPALRSEICAHCCGEKRIVEIDCPADCQWLVQGQRNEMSREWEEYARQQEPAKTRRWLAVMEGLLPLVDALERAIVGAAVSLGEVADGELAEALEGVQRSYSSESNGIFYQPSSTSPRIQLLMRSLRETVEALRETVRTSGRGELPLPAIVECLEVLAERLAFHRSRAGGPSFAAHLRRVRPPERRDGRPDVPGRLVLS